MKNRTWIIIFALIILSCAVAEFCIIQATKNSKIATVYQDGKVIWQQDLDKITERIEFDVVGDNGHINRVCAEKGRIAIIHADCPDKLCINQGFITSGAKPIVCLPNKVTITIESRKDDIDAVVGR